MLEEMNLAGRAEQGYWAEAGIPSGSGPALWVGRLGTPPHTQALLFSGIAIPENGFICDFITKDSWAQDHIGRDSPKMSFRPRSPDTMLEYLLHFKWEKLKKRGPYTTEEYFLENLSLLCEDSKVIREWEEVVGLTTHPFLCVVWAQRTWSALVPKKNFI